MVVFGSIGLALEMIEFVVGVLGKSMVGSGFNFKNIIILMMITAVVIIIFLSTIFLCSALNYKETFNFWITKRRFGFRNLLVYIELSVLTF